jgi:hypothetical protein
VRTSWRALIIAAAVLLGTFSAMTLAAASTDDTTVLHLRDTIIQQTDLDLGNKGPSLGDQFIYGGNLFRGGKKVGTDSVVCTATRIAGANTQFQCQITASLPEGQLTAQGLLPTGNLNIFAITGGTGAYRDAGGYITGRPAGNGTIITVFVNHLAD